MTWFKETFDRVNWLKDHEDKLRAMLPVEWSAPDPMLVMRISFALKVMGVMWTDYNVDLPMILARLQMTSIMQTKISRIIGDQQALSALRCNPEKISELRWKDLREREAYANGPKTEAITKEAYLATVQALNKARHESR